MEIDPHQLPVPHWDLNCPNCAYSLNGLSIHRCPECGREFNIESLLATWSRLREPRFDKIRSPLPDFGITCKKCSCELAGAEDGCCRECGTGFDLEIYRPKKSWFSITSRELKGVPIQAVMMALELEKIPYLTVPQLSPWVALPDRCFVPSEFYFDVLWVTRDTAKKMFEREQLRESGEEEPHWVCKNCGEENPDNFESCWQCGEP